nr:RNA-directed DNA polymerase, eukaryota [Tanacetum cinerariifolium]
MIGRGRDVNTTEVARHTGVEGLGEDKKGVSKAHKEYYEEGDGNNKIFMFRGMYGGEVDSHKCNISFEHVKEIGEMIGVSWATMKGKSKEEASGRVGSDGSKGVVGAEHRLAGSMDRMKGWCIFGDLNVMRRNKDRLNSHVNVNEMIELNDFINDTWLMEILMGGGKFTRVSDDGMKFSKLDRFLLKEEFNNLWGNLLVTTLDRKLSDHCPIVLKDVDLDFGPNLFRVFNVWLEEGDIYKCFEEVFVLPINYNKNRFYGIGVNDSKLRRWRDGRDAALGNFLSRIWVNMRRVNAWKPVIEKFKNRLAKWKAKK